MEEVVLFSKFQESKISIGNFYTLLSFATDCTHVVSLVF